MCTGLALGERMLNARLGDDVIDHHTFTIAGDGDMQEGISGEAGSLAGHLELGRLIAFYDDNHISIEGDTALAFSEDVGKRYEAYGWHVQNLGEDLALDRIEQATRDAMAVDGPAVADHRPHAHRARLAAQAGHRGRARLAARRGGGPAHQAGLRLGPRQAVLRPRRGARALPRRRSSAATSSVDEWEQRSGGWSGFEMPDGWDDDVPAFSPRDVPTIATRKAGGEVLKWAASKVPHLVGGSADLLPSTLQAMDGARSSPAPTTGASCTSASASTRWAPPSTASCSAASAPSARAS